MVFPVVLYGCESWTIKKVERWRIDGFELWCWRRAVFPCIVRKKTPGSKYSPTSGFSPRGHLERQADGDAMQPSHPLSPSSPPAFNLPTSGSFPVSQLFTSGGQSIGLQLQHQFFQSIIRGFPLRLTGLISLQSKGLSRVFSSTHEPLEPHEQYE